jgi:hypothetical protein
VNKQIIGSSNTKFLGLIIDETLSLRNHIDQLMSKLAVSVLQSELLKLSCHKEL